MANKQLPGMTYTYRDGNLVPSVLVPSTETLLVIGNALDGPVNNPVNIPDLATAEVIFGPLVYSGDYANPVTGLADGANADNNLIRAINEALVGGAGKILALRVGGATAYASGAFGGSVLVQAVSPGRVYNGVTVTLSQTGTGANLTLVQPQSKGGTVNYSFPAASTLMTVTNTLNLDPRNLSVRFLVPNGNYSVTVSTLSSGSVTLSGGTNGTGAPGEDNYGIPYAYYNALTDPVTGTFVTVLDTIFDIAVIAGIYADDQVVSGSAATTTSVAQAYAQWLYNVSDETQPCHGVIGLNPTGLTSPAALSTYATNSLLNTSAGYYNQSAGIINMGYFMNAGFSVTDPVTLAVIDGGRFISVFAGPDVIFTQRQLGFYIANGCAAYAGCITNTPVQNAMTNKQIGSVTQINGMFPKATLQQLNQGVGYNPVTQSNGAAAYVTLRMNNVINVPVVVEDNTCAMQGSDYQTLQVFRICNLAASLVRAVAYPYIGQPNDTAAISSISTQLTTALNNMVSAGALVGGAGTGFTFAITSTAAQQLLGQITITLFLRPALQIKMIQVVVSVTQ